MKTIQNAITMSWNPKRKAKFTHVNILEEQSKKKKNKDYCLNKDHRSTISNLNKFIN